MNIEELTVPKIESFSPPYFFFSNNKYREVLYVSPSVEQILGYSPSELVGRKYTEFLDASSPLNADVTDCRRRRFDGDGSHESLRVVQTKEGQLKVLKIQTHGVTDTDNNTVANHGLAQDVTDVYFLESKLHVRLQELRAVESQLSTREKEVLCRVKAGQLNKVIAKELKVTERAIEGIRSRLMKKFDAETIAVVVKKATELTMLNEVILLAQGSRNSRSRLEDPIFPQQAC